MSLRSLPLVVLLSAGCFSPSFDDGRTPCTSDSQCPPGFHCAATKACWHNGRDPMGDLSVTSDDGGSDLAVALDMPVADFAGVDGGLPDLTPPADLAPLIYPPAAVWSSCGGGAGAGSSTGAELNLSIGNTPVMGSSTAPSGATVTFGYFSDDGY